MIIPNDVSGRRTCAFADVKRFIQTVTVIVSVLMPIYDIILLKLKLCFIILQVYLFIRNANDIILLFLLTSITSLYSK